MIGYDTHGPQCPEDLEQIEQEDNQFPEFKLAEEYKFTYFLGASIQAGSVWVKSATKSGKSLRCVVSTINGSFERTIKVNKDDEGEFLTINGIFPGNIKVRA